MRTLVTNCISLCQCYQGWYKFGIKFQALKLILHMDPQGMSEGVQQRPHNTIVRIASSLHRDGEGEDGRGMGGKQGKHEDEEGGEGDGPGDEGEDGIPWG